MTVTVVGLVLPAAPTQAHATVVTVSPAAASELSASPRRITVRFNEPVTADAKRVQLLDALGKVVPVAYSAEGSGALQVLTPTRPLRSGLYALRWSVVSDDGHVVTGASTFTVKSRAPAGGKTVFTVTSGAKSRDVAVSAARPGAMTVNAPSGVFVRAEFKHKRLGATLPVSLVSGQARVVLPFPGLWTVVLVEKSGTFSEIRWAGSFTLR